MRRSGRATLIARGARSGWPSDMGAFCCGEGCWAGRVGAGLMNSGPPSGHHTIGGVCAGASTGGVSLGAISINIYWPLNR
jgi:hypothetical protein